MVIEGGGGQGGTARGPRISHLWSRNIKAESCVDIAGGGGPLFEL